MWTTSLFISILVGRLPENQRNCARVIGLGLAMGTRILLLLSLAWIMTLTDPLITILGTEISWRDLILIGGGLFLLWKSVHEIHNSLIGVEDGQHTMVQAGFGAVLIQIAVIDIVFSLDSVITAVGMVDQVEVMIAAIVIAQMARRLIALCELSFQADISVVLPETSIRPQRSARGKHRRHARRRLRVQEAENS